MQNQNNLKKYAPAVLRIALAGVFMWFGVSQFSNPDQWVKMVPVWATSLSGLSAGTIIMMNAWLEIIGSLLLVLNIYVRWVALVLFVHLFIIAKDFGMSPVGVRDFGLAFATLALAMLGKDDWAVL